jgi:hypothetical protein
LSFVQNWRFGIQQFFTQEISSLNILIHSGKRKETVSCFCQKK